MQVPLEFSQVNDECLYYSPSKNSLENLTHQVIQAGDYYQKVELSLDDKKLQFFMIELNNTSYDLMFPCPQNHNNQNIVDIVNNENYHDLFTGLIQLEQTIPMFLFDKVLKTLRSTKLTLTGNLAGKISRKVHELGENS